MENKTINKLALIDQLVPRVVASWGQDYLVNFALKRLEQDYQSDFDMLVEDALTFGLIEDEEEIV